MHRVAYGVGILLGIVGVGAALLAWRHAGLEALRQWAALYRPAAVETPWAWLGLGDAVLARCRHLLPLALPAAFCLAIGMVEGWDWRSAQRMRGHHAHLLAYAGGVAWASLGWLLYVVLRPTELVAPRVAPPCLAAVCAIGFASIAGLPGRGEP